MKIAAFIAVWICHLAIADSETNIIRNSGFESGTIGWKLERGDAVIESGDAQTGKRFVRVIDMSDEDTHIFQSRHFPARPGGKYTPSVQVRSKSKGGQGIYLAFFNASGARITNENVRASGPTIEWKAISLSSTVPDEAATVMVYLYSYLKDVGTYDFDDVSLLVEGGRESPSALSLKPSK
ncbi:MAG: carbohydrate binding domain-containing protein [Verrucomicrobiales bacterium]